MLVFRSGFPNPTTWGAAKTSFRNDRESERPFMRILYQDHLLLCTRVVLMVEKLVESPLNPVGKMTRKSGLPDGDLVRECLEGSEQAWENLYRSYAGLVRNVVRSKWKSFFQDSDDITQSVFLSVLASLETYDPKYSLSRFICVIAERECLQEYRRRKTAKRDAETVPVEHHDCGNGEAVAIPSSFASQEAQLTEGQLTHLLKLALADLGDRCRELLTLRYFEDLPYKEIGKIVGVNEGALRVRVSRCLEELTAEYELLLKTGTRQ